MSIDKEQILKYLNEDLSIEDRHTFEKQMLVDPFLNDAVEGLSEISSDSERRELLDAFYISFEVETAQKTNLKLWLGSAAAIILLVVVSVFVINQLNEQTESTRLSEKSTSQEDKLDRTLTEVDSIDQEPEAAPDEPVEERQEELIASEETAVESDEEFMAETMIEEISTEEGLEEDAPEEDIEQVSEDDIVLADLAEEQLHEEDDILQEQEKEAESIIAQDINQPIAEQESKKARKADNEGAAQEGAPIAARSMAAEAVPNSEPVEGFESFQKYIQDNLVYPQDAIDANISGVVTIQFNVDANGRPTDIQIANGIGYGCDEEAVRLITEGMNWTNTSGLVTYTISFNRK